MTETWKDVEGYAGMYQVSDQGRVRSWYRGGTGKGRKKGKRERPRILKLVPDTSGYLRFHCFAKGCGKMCRVHLLVLEAFIGPRPNSLVCCHGDGDKTNNRLENLRWDTASANVRDAVAHGTHPTNRGATNGNSKLTRADVIEIRRLYAAGGITQRELGKQFGVWNSAISFIIRRERWAHI